MNKENFHSYSTIVLIKYTFITKTFAWGTLENNSDIMRKNVCNHRVKCMPR